MQKMPVFSSFSKSLEIPNARFFIFMAFYIAYKILLLKFLRALGF
jgi:hypothetical protein